MVIVDTSVWIDIVNGVRNPHTDWYLLHSPLQRLGLTDLILTEVLQGTSNTAEFDRIHHLLNNFVIFHPEDSSLALQAARNYQLLRGRGITIRKTIDCLIATFCIESGHALLHRDRDFDYFEQYLGLKTIKP